MNIVSGDLLSQDTTCIVNPWNMNFIPHWLLLPGGVSGQLKKKAGPAPFREVTHHGLLWPGRAVLTGGGLLNKPIIHVAGLNALWRSSLVIVSRCTIAALNLAEQEGFASVALPLIGAGTGGLTPAKSLSAMKSAVGMSQYRGEVRIVLWSESKEVCLCQQ
ncbi:macro domain-containing protein [Rahnella sikkimica]|uniref:Macro domain-containing protein n=1 Tax=Rahnella sikkimica TaxID=1805933 RepID=A0A2L1UZ45_9GAMM|nr:macro domain-containing protein [Rahnella sikkimica]AVF38233.1 hypothetical protein BV494_25485 [Rahnella sikkimica]